MNIIPTGNICTGADLGEIVPDSHNNINPGSLLPSADCGTDAEGKTKVEDCDDGDAEGKTEVGDGDDVDGEGETNINNKSSAINNVSVCSGLYVTSHPIKDGRNGGTNEAALGVNDINENEDRAGLPEGGKDGMETKHDQMDTEECWRHYYICPSQGHYFGDYGSFIKFFDPLGRDEVFCARRSLVPFGPMVIW